MDVGFWEVEAVAKQPSVCVCVDKMPSLLYDWKSRFKEWSWYEGQWLFRINLWSCCQDSLDMMNVWVVGAKSHSVLQFLWRRPFLQNFYILHWKMCFSDVQNLSPPGFIEKLHWFTSSQQSSWSHVFEPKRMTATTSIFMENPAMNVDVFFLAEKWWDFRPAFIDCQSRMK